MRLSVAALMLCACSLALPAEVYKYKAPDGSIVFTDRKPEVPAEKVDVKTPTPPTPAERTEAARRSQALDGSARERLQRQAEEAAAARAAESRKQQADAQRCRKAREENAYYQADGVYVAAVVDGKRTFLTTEEVNQRRAAARREIEQFCR